MPFMKPHYTSEPFHVGDNKYGERVAVPVDVCGNLPNFVREYETLHDRLGAHGRGFPLGTKKALRIVMQNNNAGIDYGMGLANVDHETGIRYGVVSQNSISPDALADMEPVYPEIEHDDDCDNQDNEGYCSCGDLNEPYGYEYTQDGYALSSGTDGFGIFVTKSPYFTLAKFCSPCAPGAGSLDSPSDGGVKTYCLGADWFDSENPCPYPIYSVATGELISPTSDAIMDTLANGGAS